MKSIELKRLVEDFQIDNDILKGSMLERDVKSRMMNWMEAIEENEQTIVAARNNNKELKKLIKNEMKSWNE